VYQLAEELADQIWFIVLRWDRFAFITIGDQLVRAVDGIGANIAEGSGRGSFKDNRRFISISRGCLYETKHWLRRAYKRRLLKQEQVNELRIIIDRLTPTLNAYYRSLDEGVKIKKIKVQSTKR
jgi:four helix bundle protein